MIIEHASCDTYKVFGCLVSMVPVIQRVIEQFEGLCEYFLKFLPQQEARTCRNNQWYKQIEKHLRDKMTLTKLQFVKCAG